MSEANQDRKEARKGARILRRAEERERRVRRHELRRAKFEDQRRAVGVGGRTVPHPTVDVRGY